MIPLKQLGFSGLVCVALLAGLVAKAYTQDAPALTPDQRIAALKQSLAADQVNIKQYVWTETTAMSYKDEEKSRTQNQCSYGPDGKVQKVPLGEPAEKKDKPGLRGKIVENKKEDMAEYMKQAVALVKSYVPPDPAKLQACKDSGKFSVQMVEPGKRARLEFRDYSLPGDKLGIDVDPATNRFLGLNVSTYLEKPDDAVTLDVTYSALQDGTGYASAVELNAKAKSMKVNIQNADHKKVGP